MQRQPLIAATTFWTLAFSFVVTGGLRVADIQPPPHARLQAVGMADARWTGGFWGQRFDQCRDVMVPNLWRVMQRPDNAATFNDLRMAAGLVAKGKPGGRKWGDGDCYKCIEAMAHLFAVTGDTKLDRLMDEAVDLVSKAQQPDGYVSTWVQLSGADRWADLHNHELYNMGHLMTAACVHHRATGKQSFLNIATRVGDYLYELFVPQPKKLAHFGFNPSNIMGAVDLYRATGDPRYLELAAVFVSMRGSVKGGSDQNQAKVPLRREQEAVGHAVTAGYLWCGAADVYAHTGEKELIDALDRLWHDVTERKMYITGAVGALHHGESARTRLRRWPRDSVHEAFGREYQLPNRTAYNETCANIANAMWNHRMLQVSGDAKYADVMERVLYNSMLSGIGVGGTSFFYTNPLRRCGKGVPLLSNDSALRWTDTTPKSPVHCFCCPPNVIRTIAGLHNWAYSVSEDAVWVHLYGSGTLRTELPDGSAFGLTQQSNYPWDGKVAVRIDKAPDKPLTVMLRVPAWASAASITLNGEVVQRDCQPGKHAAIRPAWSVGDTLNLDLPMPVELVEADPLVEELGNRVAVMRGPIVYCLESPDLPKGIGVDQIVIPADIHWTPRLERHPALGEQIALEGKAIAVAKLDWTGRLYHPMSRDAGHTVAVKLIPYYAWANRGGSEMAVWLPARLAGHAARRKTLQK